MLEQASAMDNGKPARAIEGKNEKCVYTQLLKKIIGTEIVSWMRVAAPRTEDNRPDEIYYVYGKLLL